MGVSTKFCLDFPADVSMCGVFRKTMYAVYTVQIYLFLTPGSWLQFVTKDSRARHTRSLLQRILSLGS